MRDGGELPAEVKVAKHRQMYSKSPVFEAAYERFRADVLVRGISSVERMETDSEKMIVLARCRRIVLVKATGLIHMEELVGPYMGEGEEIWEPCKLVDQMFWASDLSIKKNIEQAWELRIKNSLPPAKDCFPDMPARADTGRYAVSAEQSWETFVELAGRRRVSGLNVRAAAKTMVSAVWKFLCDAELLRVCIACFGRRAAFSDYNLTVKRRKELMLREAETPNLAPLIGAYVKRHAQYKTGLKKIPSDVLPQARRWLFGEELSQAAWRYVAAGSRKLVESIVESGPPSSREHREYAGATELLNLLAETGESHPFSFVMMVLQPERTLYCAQLVAERDNFVRLFRLAGREAALAKRRKRLTRFLRGDFVLVWDWFFGDDARPDGSVGQSVDGIKKIHKNSTWASIMRAQLEWHGQRESRERLRMEADQRAYQEWCKARDETAWINVLDPLSIDGVGVTPLTTGRSLVEEGDTMDHCVGANGYLESCVANYSRIFHLRSAIEEATMEIVSRDDLNWRVRQVFGVSDCASSAQMHAVAKAVAVRYTKAAKLARKRA